MKDEIKGPFLHPSSFILHPSSLVLVIGYGNELRGDDGIGPHVVSELAALELPGVLTRIVHQLLPELAAELADTCLVIFVDAQLRISGERSTGCVHRCN